MAREKIKKCISHFYMENEAEQRGGKCSVKERNKEELNATAQKDAEIFERKRLAMVMEEQRKKKNICTRGKISMKLLQN